MIKLLKIGDILIHPEFKFYAIVTMIANKLIFADHLHDFTTSSVIYLSTWQEDGWELLE